jgi:hypothetical protein
VKIIKYSAFQVCTALTKTATHFAIHAIKNTAAVAVAVVLVLVVVVVVVVVVV